MCRSPRIAKLTDQNAQKGIILHTCTLKCVGVICGFMCVLLIVPGKKVCRSLFSRSMSISCDVSTKRKREREEGEREDTENHLAKRKKSESICTFMFPFYKINVYTC